MNLPGREVVPLKGVLFPLQASHQLNHWDHSSFLHLQGAVDHAGSRDCLHPLPEDLQRVS
jgi:hypothetical protein